MTAPTSVTDALDRLERLANAATPAPWVQGEWDGRCRIPEHGEWGHPGAPSCKYSQTWKPSPDGTLIGPNHGDQVAGRDEYGPALSPENAALMAAVRNALPALIRIARAALAVHAADAATGSADPDLRAALDALPEAMR